jgi:hypothetical protein
MNSCWFSLVPVMPTLSNNKLVLDVIDKGLTVLGNTPKQAIWSFLENDFNVKPDELPKNIRLFTGGLEKIFGMGYKFLDQLFCHYLEEATGKQFPKGKPFCEHIELLCCLDKSATSTNPEHLTSKQT